MLSPLRFALRPAAATPRRRRAVSAAARGALIFALVGGTGAYAAAQGTVLADDPAETPAVASSMPPDDAGVNMFAALGAPLVQDGVASRSQERLAVPRILSVTVDGSTTPVATRAVTVAGLLAERGIVLGPHDTVSLPLDDATAVGIEVVVTRVTFTDVTESREIAFSTIKRSDYTLDPGQRVVQTAGQAGSESSVYRVRLVDGVEASRELLLQSRVNPVSEVVRVGVSAAPSGTYTGTDPRAIGQRMVAERGWSSGQFDCLNALWTKESNWNPYAQNPSSGAYGIPQSLPGSKMGTVADDWRTNPVTQITWGLNYISARYGTPCAAWSHSVSHNWY